MNKMKKVNDTLFIVHDSTKGLKGIVDVNGQKISLCIYEDIFYVKKHQQFIIKKNHRYGMMDVEGNVLVDPEYLHIGVKHYNNYIIEDGYYIKSKDGFGRISTKGEIIVEPKYIEIVRKGKTFYEAETKEHRKILYHISGKRFDDSFSVLNEGYFYSRMYDKQDNLLYQLYNEKFEMINDSIQINYRSKFVNGFMRVTVLDETKNKHCGYVDGDGNIISKEYFDDGGHFTKEGTVIVTRDGKYGAMDMNGNIIIPLEYDNGMILKMVMRLWRKIDYGVHLIDKENLSFLLNIELYRIFIMEDLFIL